jgi:hypothetical protein
VLAVRPFCHPHWQGIFSREKQPWELSDSSACNAITQRKVDLEKASTEQAQVKTKQENPKGLRSFTAKKTVLHICVCSVSSS